MKWREVSIAAAITAFLFVLGKFALGLYLWKAAVGSGFGTAGSIIVVLVWVYWSALIFLFGVEFTHVYAMVDRRALGLAEPMRIELTTS
jgi:membrane protein